MYVVAVPHGSAFHSGRWQTTGICVLGLHHEFGCNRRLTDVITEGEQSGALGCRITPWRLMGFWLPVRAVRVILLSEIIQLMSPYHSTWGWPYLQYPKPCVVSGALKDGWSSESEGSQRLRFYKQHGRWANVPCLKLINISPAYNRRHQNLKRKPCNFVQCLYIYIYIYIYTSILIKNAFVTT